MLRTLALNSAIYTFANLLQKGAAFLLLPLYTRYLMPDDYGVLAVVTALNGFLGILFTLGLTGSITRFYFEHRDEPQVFAEFMGSVLVFIMLLSAVLLAVLLAWGESLLRPLIGTIPFWPYIALAMVSTFFVPIFTTHLALLQMRNEATRYLALALANFACLTALSITLVVGFRQGVLGALVATLATAVLFGCISLWMMRRQIRVSLRWGHLRPALSYGLPLVPHSVATQSTAFTDRLVLNSVAGTATAGIYSVGAMIAMVIEVAAQSVNRAYVPMSMDARKRADENARHQLRDAGVLIVASFLLLALAVGSFARELMQVFASAAYQPAAVVVPWLAMVGAVNAAYLVFVSALFYDRVGVRLVPIGTLAGAGCSVLFTLLLIPRLGLVGGAIAALLAQSAAAALIALLGRRYEPVHWPYLRVLAGFLLFLPATLFLGALDLSHPLLTVLAKLAGIGVAGVLVGLVFWNSPLAFFRALRRLADAGRTWLARRAA